MDGQPKRLGYLDPPYPGEAWRYRGHPDYAGEVDHYELITDAVENYDGWALSTSSKALGQLLAICAVAGAPTVQVAAWVKPNGPDPRVRGPHRLWEPVLYVPARRRQGAKVRDWLYHPPARGGDSDLVGRKPVAFAMWVFKLLGALPVDHLDDRFPGSGVVGSSWRQFQAAAGASLLQRRDASPRSSRDASPAAEADTSPEYSRDGVG